MEAITIITTCMALVGVCLMVLHYIGFRFVNRFRRSRTRMFNQIQVGTKVLYWNKELGDKCEGEVVCTLPEKRKLMIKTYPDRLKLRPHCYEAYYGNVHCIISQPCNESNTPSLQQKTPAKNC